MPTANLWAISFLSFAVTFALCYVFIRFHHLHSIGAKADKRRHNERPVPLLGGAGILGGFAAGCLALHVLDIDGGNSIRLFYAFASIALAVALGLVDDANELRARWKFLGHNLVALLLVLSVQGLETPPDRVFGQGSAAAYALKWFWCLGLLNSMNLIDGLDELSSGVGLLVLGFVTLLGAGDAPFRAPLLFVAIPAVLGFYLWNRHPARIYLGEAGAQAVAVFLFLGTMTFSHSASPGLDIVALFFALGVPILDTLLAILRRFSRGTGLMVADREHLHHRFGRLGLSHPNISRFLHFLTLYLCGVAYCFLQLETLSVAALSLALAGLGINLFLLNLAEKKLYSYLANFASHMLRVIDNGGADPLSLQLRRRSLEEAGLAHVAFRVNLSHCVGNLLERSPGRIQSFYGKLGDALRGENEGREVHFESSRSVIVLQRLLPGGLEPGRIAFELRAELERFEQRERIDLGLHLAQSIRRLPAGEVPAPAGEARADIRSA